MTDEPNRLHAVRSGYDRWAAVYDQELNPLVALEGPLVRAAVGEARGLAALDLGCGTGRHALWLAESGARVTAIDFSHGMLGEARRKPGAETVEFVEHDLHRPLPFPAGAFDLVVSGLVIEHLKDLDDYLREASRVIRPGGRAIVSGMHPAMFLKGTQARFTDPSSGEVVTMGSVAHSVGGALMAGIRAGLRPTACDEYAADAALAERCPRAGRYIGWPMLMLLQFTRD